MEQRQKSAVKREFRKFKGESRGHLEGTTNANADNHSELKQLIIEVFDLIVDKLILNANRDGEVLAGLETFEMNAEANISTEIRLCKIETSKEIQGCSWNFSR